jgi:two-component system, sensor histidine kinase and response regulator
MKRLCVFSKDHFEFLLEFLPESKELTYCFFSEIKLLTTLLKQKKPDALLVESAELNNVILNCVDFIDDKTPIIVLGNTADSSNFPNLQIQFLLETSSKSDILKLFSRLNLINENDALADNLSKNDTNLNTTKISNTLENQPFLDFLMDNIPDTIYFKDRESRFTKINHAQAVTLGINNPEDAIGKRDEDFFDIKISKEAYKDEQHIMNTGVPLINKLERLTIPQAEKYVRATKIPLKDEKGNCIGLVGISRDVSKEYVVEKELLREKKFMDLLMDNLPDRIYFKDRNSQFIRCNMALAKIFGLNAPEEMYGKTDLDFFEPIHAKEAFEDEQRIMRERTLIVDKLESYLKGRERIWELTTKIPFVNSKDEVVGLVGISHDFTKQKQLEDKLKREKDLLQMLMDNVPDYIYFKDINTKYIRANKAIANFFKTDVNNLIGKADVDFLSKAAAKKTHKQDLFVLNKEKVLINEVEKLQDLDGNTVWISTTKVPIKDENSQVIGLVGVSRDVTMLELTKQHFEMAKIKAEEANEAKSLFLANMSHEIRTPMNGIIGMADIMSKSNLDVSQKEYLDIIMKSGQTLLSLINNILDFSKIESGKMELETVPINIRSVIEEVADMHVVQATSKSVDLLTYIDPEIPEFVGGDYIRLKQIITNLVNNAIKFTSKGEVVVHVNYLGKVNGNHEISFKVKDTGIGIAEENQKKLFRSFSQVDASSTRKYGGTGLGLAISQRLVGLMKGELKLESALNSGSLFYFKCEFLESINIQSNHVFLSKKQLKGKHIVIVDDNITNRLIFNNYLKTWQVKVTEFKDGYEALAFFKNQPETLKSIDLVLVDYHMPGMNGRELAESIKADNNTKHLKLILLSSITDAIPSAELKRIGFETGLNKPIKMNQLLNVTLQVLGMPQQQKASEDSENENHYLIYKNKRFLIVEDNLVNIRVAQIVLKGLSPHVEVAKNGLEAVELFQKNKYDIILMDIRMPVMDGIEATLEIRKLEKNIKIKEPVKIIALTANTFQEDIETCMDNGMDAFLEKPFTRKDLVTILQRLL